jgi:hypothetical protein
MTLDDVKKTYRTMHASVKQNYTRERKHEAALFTELDLEGPGRNFPKVFKGDCRTRGQKGHKSANCWERPSNKDKRPPT